MVQKIFIFFSEWKQYILNSLINKRASLGTYVIFFSNLLATFQPTSLLN